MAVGTAARRAAGATARAGDGDRIRGRMGHPYRRGPGLADGLCAGGWLVYASATSPGAWFAILALALAAAGLGCLYPLLRRHQRQLADQARRRAAEERRKA